MLIYVEPCDAVVREFIRCVKPGGHAVLMIREDNISQWAPYLAAYEVPAPPAAHPALNASTLSTRASSQGGGRPAVSSRCSIASSLRSAGLSSAAHASGEAAGTTNAKPRALRWRQVHQTEPRDNFEQQV